MLVQHPRAAMSMPSRYHPINCEFHDLLEAAAVRAQAVALHYRDADATQVRAHARIVDVFARDGAEYLRLESGELIRLDRIESLDGVRMASFPLPP